MSFTLRKRGDVWYARLYIPYQKADGSIAWGRIERSTHTGNRKRAKQTADKFESEYWDHAYNKPQRGQTFAGAAITYMETTGNKRYIKPLLQHFGTKALSEIDQAAMARACHVLYPNCAPSTHNRQVYTPVLRIMKLAKHKHDIERPKGHDAATPLEIPPEDWFDAVLPHCEPELAALLVFLTLTGRRVSEALALHPDDIDLAQRRAILHTTKSGKPAVVKIPGPAMASILAIPNWRGRDRLFRYAHRSNWYPALREACRTAGVRYYPFHALGRHAAATRLLRAGYSLAHVQKALGWASIQMPARRYSHLEQSEVDEAVDAVGRTWGQGRQRIRRAG